MTAPIQRRYTRALPLALNAFLPATDDLTTATETLLTTPNAILDYVNGPDPAAGLLYTARLIKNGIDTGITAFSTNSSAASAGRSAIGPIDVQSGNVSWSVAQTLGALAAYSFIVKYAKRF